MKLKSALGVAAFILVGLGGCGEKKQDKTCTQEGDSGGTVGAPWTEFEVASGEICVSSAKELKFIVKNEKDPIGVSTKVADKLKAKGFNPVEGSLNVINTGKGGDATVSIYGWKFKKGDQTIDLTMSSYPASIWNDDPVSITLNLK